MCDHQWSVKTDVDSSEVSDSADCSGRKDMGIVVLVLDSPRTSWFACLEIVLWIVLINQGLVYCLCTIQPIRFHVSICRKRLHFSLQTKLVELKTQRRGELGHWSLSKFMPVRPVSKTWGLCQCAMCLWFNWWLSSGTRMLVLSNVWPPCWWDVRHAQLKLWADDAKGLVCVCRQRMCMAALFSTTWERESPWSSLVLWWVTRHALCLSQGFVAGFYGRIGSFCCF